MTRFIPLIYLASFLFFACQDSAKEAENRPSLPLVIDSVTGAPMRLANPWKNAGCADIDRQLNKRGKKDGPRMNAWLAQSHICPELVLCSPAVRAVETLAMLTNSAFNARGAGARLFGWHRIVRLDGTLSIARSYRPGDWPPILAEASVAGARVYRAFPFRLCVEKFRRS